MKIESPEKHGAIETGTLVLSRDGTKYVAIVKEKKQYVGEKEVTIKRVTIRRMHPKVRGKAARRADKKARRLAREAKQQEAQKAA